MSPASLCIHPGCIDLATYRGRCQQHARQRTQQTRSANAPIYNSRRWKITRRHKLSLNPICEDCDQRIAEHVHHKTDLQAGGDPWAIDGLEALCASCHNRTTARRLHGRLRGR